MSKLFVYPETIDFIPESSPDIILIKESTFFEECNKLEKEYFQEIKISGFLPSDDQFSIIYKLLRPSGKLLIEKCIPTREDGQATSSELKIHGFIDIMAAKDPLTTERFIVCEKPNWSSGSAASISKPLKSKSNGDQNTWKMNLDDLADEDLIDESALLNTDINIPISKSTGECGEEVMGKKRACKNCTCGLAENESAKEIENMTIEEKVSKSSSCGNCYKGDAYRCGSCPFLGMPAFEPGNEKVVLSMGVDDI